MKIKGKKVRRSSHFSYHYYCFLLGFQLIGVPKQHNNNSEKNEIKIKGKKRRSNSMYVAPPGKVFTKPQ